MSVNVSEGRPGATMPALMIAAVQGRSGKTTLSVGICAALRDRGCIVQAFKKGPDYIDPSWLTAATGRSCRNLDTFLMGEETARSSFDLANRRADITVVEGAMGLFDGVHADGRGSSANLARLLGIPVVLVINTARMTRSVAAVVMGCQHFEPETMIAGVVLNNVSGERHAHKLRRAVEDDCKVPVVGVIPRNSEFLIAERHLGLIPFGEEDVAASRIERLGLDLVQHLDVDAILEVASRSRAVKQHGYAQKTVKKAGTRIGVIRDNAFTFYYPENLEALEEAGAELVFIDSLRDRTLPDLDRLYVGGGFPEFFLADLEKNVSLRHDIAKAVEEGLPVYAECAGLMYLCRRIRWRERNYKMVGILKADVDLCERPQGHGYVEAEVTRDNCLFPKGSILRGHEFHHSRLVGDTDFQFGYRLRRGRGITGRSDGIMYKNVFAAYTHLHALGVPEWAGNLVSGPWRMDDGLFDGNLENPSSVH